MDERKVSASFSIRHGKIRTHQDRGVLRILETVRLRVIVDSDWFCCFLWRPGDRIRITLRCRPMALFSLLVPLRKNRDHGSLPVFDSYPVVLVTLLKSWGQGWDSCSIVISLNFGTMLILFITLLFWVKVELRTGLIKSWGGTVGSSCTHGSKSVFYYNRSQRWQNIYNRP